MALFAFTITYEIIIVMSTLAIAERRKVLSPLLSAALEPIKLLSLLFIIGSQNQYLAIIVITIATAVGNYSAIVFMNWLDRKRQEKTNG